MTVAPVTRRGPRGTATAPIDPPTTARIPKAQTARLEATSRRDELASFLRSRRERVSPQQVGLPSGGRRRTPGLRREEVAQLSGVGVTWYTWLEQGRDITASRQVVDAVARTLVLDPAEHRHLLLLAGHADDTEVEKCVAITDSMRAVLTQLEPYPACVQNAKYDVLAYNRAYQHIVEDLDAVEPADRNCMWLAFTSPVWKKALPDWQEVTARMAANMRNLNADHVDDPGWKAHVARLRLASPRFAELWDTHDVRAIENKPKRFRNARVGMLHLQVTNTWLAPRSGQRLLVYTPLDAETEQRLHRLVATS